MTRDVKEYMRLIDVVTVKGSKTPVELWTFDVDFTFLKMDRSSGH